MTTDERTDNIRTSRSASQTNKYQIFYDKVMNDEKLERIYMANLKDVPPSALWLLLTIRDQGWTCVRMVTL